MDLQDVEMAMLTSDLPNHASRSAEMPMPGGDDQMKLVDLCARSNSLYELYLQLPKLAHDLERNPVMRQNNFRVVETVRSLREMSWVVCELLHSMSPRVVESIVKGTFAYDSQRHIDCYPKPSKYDGEIPGIYVVGLSRRGEKGRFLNINEMETLIQWLQFYIEGYLAYAKKQYADLSSDEEIALKRLKAVDSEAGGNPSPKPVFIEKDEEIPRIRALIDTFKKMCNRSLDATGTVRMLQSPLYVGCSKNLADRMSIYEKNSLKGMNKPLGLTVCIMRKLNKPLKLHVCNVIRIWEPTQLPIAEQLVASLASSLIYQHGFNATEAGGTGPNTITSASGIMHNTKMVMSDLKHLATNAKNSIAELEQRKGFVDSLNKIRGSVADIAVTMEQCDRQLRSLPEDFRWNNTLTKLEELVDRLQKEVEQKKEILRFWELMVEIQQLSIQILK
ncbi:hypothetical protein FPSE_11100 [Fusarium pseudograminearum CS3096]|uniref:Uncharacterized protein n=2 Tax=Fusarium pseudograminearum TaxID=101028 RepID=K3V620_FUSPC|nr:hypothetical protein FPSE_11100 [Fusarium pseudograminearum CS3096]EKJ68722.1 hypothetical protein FPSE_11100 [Fusarium pseudograminearum CS3096]CEG02893.1 unnamed protein product [Fusarium pseudograminearum CS3487]